MRYMLERCSSGIALILAIALAGCSALGLDLNDDVSGGDVYVGEDAATITVTTEQVGCCYMEGSLRFARLDGPSSFDWAVDDGSSSDGDADDRYLIGVQTSSVKPGDYTLTSWEQVCDGNCGNLDAPSSHCSIDFTALPGETVEILVSYTIPEPCTVELLK